MDQQGRHLRVGESQRLQHDRPIDTMGRDQDVLADDMERRPPITEDGGCGFPRGTALTECRIVSGGIGDVVHKRVEPDVRDKSLSEFLGERDAPLETGRRTGDAKVPFEFFHSIAEFGNAEFRNDKGVPHTAAAVDQVEKPLLWIKSEIRVCCEAEVEVLLLALLDRLPLGAELTIGTSLLVGKELFLAHAVEPPLRLLVDPAAAIGAGHLVLPEKAEVGADTFPVHGVGGGSPSGVSDAKLLPKRAEFRRHGVHILLRRNPLLLRALLDFLSVLINTGQEEDFAPGEALETRDDIRENLLIGVPDVRGAVGVVDRGGDEERFHEMTGVPGSDPGGSGAILAPHERIRALVPADSASGIWWFLT